MSEFGGLWKHENNQLALVVVPPKTECGCLSGGGIKNGHIHYPSQSPMEERRKGIFFKPKKHACVMCVTQLHLHTNNSNTNINNNNTITNTITTTSNTS